MEIINNIGKAIGEIATELDKGMIFWGIIAEICEKYNITERNDIKEVCDFLDFNNKLRHYLYDRLIN